MKTFTQLETSIMENNQATPQDIETLNNMTQRTSSRLKGASGLERQFYNRELSELKIMTDKAYTLLGGAL